MCVCVCILQVQQQELGMVMTAFFVAPKALC